MIIVETEDEMNESPSEKQDPYTYGPMGPLPSREQLDESSNCDYMSEVFKEQLSELEYSKIIADSEEKEIT